MHALAPFAAIEAGQLTRTGYGQLLCSLFQFHFAIAVAAERFGWSAFSSSGKRLELLITDLDDLGVAPPESHRPVLRSRSPEEALGAIYVAEGSMIGGKLIAAQLDPLFGSEIGGRRFFTGRGQGDSIAWRRLIVLIEDRLAPAATLASAIAGALEAFDLFEALVRQPPAAPYSPGLTRNCSMRPLAGS